MCTWLGLVMCRLPVAQGGRAGAGVGRLEHVAVIWQGVGASHWGLPHTQQVLAGGQGQRVILGAEISLSGRKMWGRQEWKDGKEEKCPETRATAIATRMARWACTGCTNGSTREPSPSVGVVNKLSHNGPQKQRKPHRRNKPWLFQGYAKKASCLKASKGHVLGRTLTLCSLGALISKAGFCKGE